MVREGYRFAPEPQGPVWVYRLDKQKVSTLQALERIAKEFAVRRRDLSVCGLKDKQGRTEQLVGVLGGALGASEVVQTGDLRLKLIGRTAQPLSSANISANRFEVTVRDLSGEEASRSAEAIAEVQRVGVVNYFDSQRFGFLKHGQGFLARHLVRGDWEAALKAFLATPSELDHSDDAKVKAFWRDHWGEWQLRAPHEAARRYAPLLRRLREDPRDFKGAFLHIDRRVRAMALFELQSFIWNEGVKRYLSARVPPPELIGLRYQAGSLVFPRALPRGLRDELWARTFPLLAPESTFEDDDVRDAALGALRAQGLRLEDLRVPPGNRLQALKGNRAGQCSIRINEQYPIHRRLRMSECLLIPVARPLTLHKPIRIAPTNLRCPIRTKRIDHDNLIAPTQAVEARADIPLFVETDNNGGDRGVYPQLGILGGHVS